MNEQMNCERIVRFEIYLNPKNQPCHIILKTLSVSPVGSQRISDSEFSDYDCEDGVGVVSGKIYLEARFFQNKVLLCCRGPASDFLRFGSKFYIDYMPNASQIGLIE